MKNFKFIFISILFAGVFLFSACSPFSVNDDTGSITISLPRSGARDVVENNDAMAAWRSVAKKSDFEIRLYNDENALVCAPVILSANNSSYTFAELQPGKYLVSVLGNVKLSHKDMQGTSASGEGKAYELMYPLGEERDGENFSFLYLTGYGYSDVEVQVGKTAQAGVVIRPMNNVDNCDLPESVAGFIATKMTPGALFVKTDGDDADGDGSFEKPYKTLKNAILKINDAAIKDKENKTEKAYAIVVCGELKAEEGKALLDLSDVELMENLAVGIKGMGTGVVLKGNGNRVINYNGKNSIVLTLSNLTIKDGVASDDNGGGINFAGSGALFLYDCVVTGNKTGNGKAVSSGQNGAGVYVGDGSNVTINNCIFKENSAMGDAGAVYGNGVSVIIYGGLFEGNSSGRGGGAIYMNGGMLSVYPYDSTPAKFVNNKAIGTAGTSYGGAIKIKGNIADRNHGVSNAIFEGNEALGGGAICVQSGNITVSDSQFTGNKATGEIGGGAIYIGGDGTSQETGTMTISDSTVRKSVLGNSSANGAVYIYVDSQLTLGGKVICDDGEIYIKYSTEDGHYDFDESNWESKYPIKLDTLDYDSSIAFGISNATGGCIGMFSNAYTYDKDELLTVFKPAGSFSLATGMYNSYRLYFNKN